MPQIAFQRNNPGTPLFQTVCPLHPHHPGVGPPSASAGDVHQQTLAPQITARSHAAEEETSPTNGEIAGHYTTTGAERYAACTLARACPARLQG